MSWKGRFKPIPNEENLFKRFWVVHYVLPITIAEERATKLWEWLNRRYPCKCQCCGYVMDDREDWAEVDTILCDECTSCYSCGKFIQEDDSHYTENDNGPYCPHCYNNKFTTCSVCDDVVEIASTYSHGSYTLCQDCTDCHTFCYDCGKVIHIDNAYYLDEVSNNFCKSCFEETYPPTELPSLGNGVLNGCGRQNLEKSMAMVIIRYYATISANLEWGSKEQFRLTEAELKTISQYFVTTAAAELRHAPKCRIVVDDHWCLRILHAHCNSVNWRLSSSRNLVMGTTSLLDMDIYNSIKFLRSAYVVFYSENWHDLEGSFGGKNWANCCLQAINLLSVLNSQDGYADNLLWEICLNASHNNSNWLSKVPGDSGILWVLYVLNMGASLSPKQILDIYYSDDPFKSLPCDGHPRKTNCDFSRLPDPGSVWFYDEEETKTIPDLICMAEQSKLEPVMKSIEKPPKYWKVPPGKHEITLIPTPSIIMPTYVEETSPTLITHTTEKGEYKYDLTELEELYTNIGMLQTASGMVANRSI